MGKIIHDAEQSVTALWGCLQMAAHLNRSAESPLLRVDCVYFDADGRPLDLAVSHFDPQRYSYRVRLRRHQR